MVTKKKKSPTWNDVKKVINKFDKNQFIDLLGDLYRLSESNKNFFNARFSLGDDPLAPYKRIIKDSLHPYLEDGEVLQIGRAEEAVEQYCKAVDNPESEADLRIFFVEIGNNFTLSYGDIYDEFYDALLDMFEKAVYTVLELPSKQRKTFKDRLQKILDDCGHLGWGYGDGLHDIYNEGFPDDF